MLPCGCQVRVSPRLSPRQNQALVLLLASPFDEIIFEEVFSYDALPFKASIPYVLQPFSVSPRCRSSRRSLPPASYALVIDVSYHPYLSCIPKQGSSFLYH